MILEIEPATFFLFVLIQPQCHYTIANILQSLLCKKSYYKYTWAQKVKDDWRIQEVNKSLKIRLLFVVVVFLKTLIPLLSRL